MQTQPIMKNDFHWFANNENVSVISRMKLQQTTTQIRQGTRFHNVRHHLNLATCTSIRSRQSPSCGKWHNGLELFRTDYTILY